MFRRDDPTRMQAVLDWEMSTLGDPLTDVGHGRGVLDRRRRDHVAQPPAAGAPRQRRLPRRRHPARSLRDRRAAPTSREIDFYRAFATYKLAVIAQGGARRVEHTDPERAARVTGTVEQLADLALDLTKGYSMTRPGLIRSTSTPTATTRRRPAPTSSAATSPRSPTRSRTASPTMARAGSRRAVDRYHLYYSHYCPWAQRPMIALKLRGLDRVISSSAVDPVRDGRGLGVPRGPRARSRSGQRVRAPAAGVPRHRPQVRRSHLGAGPVGPGDEPAGEQPLRDHDRRPGDAVRRVRRSGRGPLARGARDEITR